MADFVFNINCVLVCFLCYLEPSFGTVIGKDETSIYQSTSKTFKLVAATVLTCILLALIKWHCNGGVCRSKARLDGKTAIVTGANTGIGKETALDFAKRGAKVILACRDKEKAIKAAKDIIAETGSDKVLVRVVDLSSFESVRAFAKLINETEERLDILVNNAGMIAPYSITKDGYERVFQVNYLSHFLLTLLLIEKLKKSAPSRIVNVSSRGSEFKKLNLQLDDFELSKEKYNSFNRYCESKLAQVVFTAELSRRLEGTGVTVYVLHPGAVMTDILRQWKVFQMTAVKKVIQALVFFLAKNCQQGAQTTIYCSVAEELAGESGHYYTDCKVKEHPRKTARDPGLAKKLWEASERVSGENWKDQF